MSSGREEGEIDSEEDGLRKRINELEEENAKYEKIRGFTDCYLDKYGHIYELNDYNNDFEAAQRAGQVPTDVSSISSIEFQTPKKKKHKRNKKTKCKVHARRSNRCTHQRQKHCKSEMHEEKRPHPHHHHHHNRERVVLNPYYEQPGIETISLDSTDMSDYERDNYSIAAMEIESPDENYDTTLPLSREELRLALGRGAAERKNNLCPLKERLQPDKFIPIENDEDKEEDRVQTFEKSTGNFKHIENNVVEITSDNSISIEEHELRLIALRSAIMKKHATRKKRNAEIAYSPTDFDDLVVEPISIVDSEIDELHGDMEISPASSPRLLLSPIHCDDEQNSNISLETIEQQIDTKPIDMDIVSSDSEHEDNVAGGLHEATHDIPLPPDAPPIKAIIAMPPAMTFDYVNHNSAIASYDMYMPPAIHYSTPLEMPQALLAMPPAPPAPPIITTTTDVMEPLQLMHVNDNNVKNEVANDELISSASPKSASMDIIAEDTQDAQSANVEGSDAEDGEAEALRALLLSQRQMAKATKTNAIPRLRKPSPAQHIPQIVRNHSPDNTSKMQEESIIIKPLPLQLPILQINHAIDTKPTESILKEAVRRLKVKKTKHSCDEEPIEHAPPRLTIKSFARCAELEENGEKYLLVAHAQTRQLTVNETSQSHDTNSHFMQLQQEESRSSFELERRKGSAPEILGIHATSIENTVAHALPQKRRLENEMANSGRTLRIIELRQDIEYSSSQHTSEDSSSNNAELEKSDNEKQAKKFKTSTNEQVDHTQNSSVISTSSKERIPENATNKDKNVSASGEKENQELPKEGATKNDGLANVVAKAIKPVHKLTRAAVEKRKISPLTIAGLAKATTSVIAKQPPKKTSPAATNAPPKVVNPLSKQLKIVKPNKVINKNVEITQNAPQKSNDTEKSSEASTQSRILTTSTIPNIKVNKLIIRVGGDAESSSEDEEVLRHQTLERCIRLTSARTATPDSLTGILNENLYSGKQQQLTEVANDDASNASSAAQQDAVMSAATETFEKKLEDFLKNMRSKTQSKNHSTIEHARVRKISASSKQSGTPTAVRSLPTASQEEYKRLVHRMKILEKQKQLKKMQKTLLEDAEKYSKNKKDNATQKLQKTKTVNFSETATQTSNDASSVGGRHEQQATTIGNGTDENNTKKCESTETGNNEVDAHAPNAEEEAAKEQLARSAKLQTCEKVVTNISNNIIKRLDKSLHLVNDAKLSKIAKMRHERRLKELRLEMEQVQRKMKEEQLKMSRIYPEICANNEVITSLKQKRTKVLEMAMKLGKSVKGDDYRVNNNLKSEITHKTKGLATHIKLVNSLTYSDLDKLDNEAINKTNIEKETKSNANANDRLEIGAAVAQEVVLNTHAAISSENADSVALSHQANDEANAECKTNEISTTEVCTNALDGHVINAQAAPEENCDNAKAEGALEMCTDDSVTNAEEQKKPAPTCYNGGSKEVQRQRDDVQPENVAADDEVDVKEAMAQTALRQSSSVRDYVSPLVHLKSESGKWNPNDIICPYELMGQCEDKECSYRHLTDK